MPTPKLTLKSVDVRAVLLPLKRPVVSKVGLFDQWPMVLIDLYTDEGIVGRSYLEPYLRQSVKYIVPAIRDLARGGQGQADRARSTPSAPGRASLDLVGLEGMSLIAVSGLDMAVWDALAKAADLPLVRLLGGSPAPVPAYNSNGLWLIAIDKLGREAADLVAEGGFKGLKLRLGRERLADDLAAIRVVREAVGADVRLMVDFNQGLSLGDALHRCHALDDQGLYWLEEPIAYDNLAGYSQLTRELKTPIQLGENFYGPRALFQAVAGRRRRIHDARPDADRRRDRLAARRRHRRRGRHRDVDPSLSRSLGASHAGHRNGALARVAGLGRSHPGRDVQARGRPSRRSRSARQRHRVERRGDQAPSTRCLIAARPNVTWRGNNVAMSGRSGPLIRKL